MPSPLRLFRSLVDEYLEETFRLFPQEGSALGRRELDGLLGPNDVRTHCTWQRLQQGWLHTLEALPADAFTGDDFLDRRGLLALLRTGLFHSRREDWRRNPQLHVDAAVNSIFHLALRYAGQLPRALPLVESRLAELPRFLAEGAACVREPVPLWTELSLASAEGAVTFLEEFGAELAGHSPEPERTRALAAAGARAFQRYAASIAAKAPGPAGGFAVGQEGFEMLVRERTGLRDSAPELAARGERLVAELSAAVAAEARRHGRGTAREILEQAAARWQPEAGGLLEEYRRVNEAVKGSFAEAGLVSFPRGERCRVLPVPAFLRHHFPTAAYSQPGAFDRDQTGIFWVNDLSGEQPPGPKRQAEVRQHFGLEFTCAHEAYPGHHLQFCLQNRHPSRVRRLFHHAIFYEGWTLWCEKMAVEQGIFALPEARLIYLHDALWRAHRIGIDVGLHAGGWSVARACRRLQAGVGFTAARARGDVNWYTSSPTVPLSYLLGRLELEKLYHHQAARGWSLRQFNDWALSFGAIPWSWIWESQLVPTPITSSRKRLNATSPREHRIHQPHRLGD